MKYNQPYGVSDPNAPYINGNPTTGTMGSIPPAASIENPQREIVNFETDSGLTPTDADLHQLSKSVQSGLVNYAADAGTPNFIAITPTPPITAYALGQRFVVKLANSNTTIVKINVSNLGNVPLVHTDLSELQGGELTAGAIIEVAFDGAGHFQLLTGAGGGLSLMTASRTVFVNDATGDDINFDGSQATVSGTHGPFKTLQKALAVMTKYNLGGFTFTINMADGNYNITSGIICPPPNGSGNVLIHGNTAAANVQIKNVGTGPCLVFSQGSYILDGLFFHTTTSDPVLGSSAVWANGAANVSLNTIFFGSTAAAGTHFQAGPGGVISVIGPINISGSADVHQLAFTNGIIAYAPSPMPTLNINTSVTFTAFAIAATGGQIGPTYAAINFVGGATVTAIRYEATGNGVINTSGRGATYLPGSSAGTTATGGQYL